MMTEFLGQFTLFYSEFINSLGLLWSTITGTIIGQIIIYTTLILIVIKVMINIIKESV